MHTSEYDNHTKKTYTIEFLNSLFIFIILFLHYTTYTTNYFWILSAYKVTSFLQKLSVGGFIFLSGFKLAKAKISDSSMAFIVNRFLRIYPLYLLAVIVFSFTAYPYVNKGDLPSLPNIIIHVLCLQSIVPDMFQANYSAIWFVSVLVCCYGFFLLTRRKLQSTFLFFLFLFLSSLSIFTIHVLGRKMNVAIFDEDLFIYLVFFALGMFYSNSRKIIDEANNRILGYLFIFGFVCLILFYNGNYLNFWYAAPAELFFILISTVPICLLAFKIIPTHELSVSVSQFLSWVSYSSFCVFLFHRPIWSVMATIWSERSLPQWLFILGFGIPTIFASCYLIQRIYNRVITSVRQISILQKT